jgi:uracil-DNA glycosylase
LISFDNDDATAANGLECLLVSGLPRYLTVNWNIVPWYLQAVRKPTGLELEEAVPALEQFLRLLPRLEVVVLLGKSAEEGWPLTGLGRPGLRVLSGPHPSPQNFNTRPDSRRALVEVFRTAAGLIGD